VKKVYAEIESSMTKKDLNNTLFLLNKISLIYKK
ncbi:MAG: hypothetical protein ACI85X_000486, partial [Woeseiaceae bacterium]